MERRDQHERKLRRFIRDLSFRDMILLVLMEIFDMSAELDRLTQEVQQNSDSVDSIITLVNGLADQIRNSVNDPAALNKLADDLDAQQGRLAAAVAANTPAAPAPTEPQPTPPEEPAPTPTEPEVPSTPETPVDETPPGDNQG